MAKKIFPYMKKKKSGTFTFHVRNKSIANVPIKNLLDVGCCVGAQLEAYRHLMKPEMSYGFEPSLENFYKAINRFSDMKDVYLFNTAVSCCNDEKILNMYPNISQHSLKKKNDTSEVEQRMVPVTRLDSWARREDVDSFDFVKIDTQGEDSNVLIGMGDMIYTVKILIVEIMMNGHEYAQTPRFTKVFDYVLDKGLIFHSFRDIYHEPNGMAQAVDAIFMNGEALKLATIRG